MISKVAMLSIALAILGLFVLGITMIVMGARGASISGLDNDTGIGYIVVGGVLITIIANSILYACKKEEK